MLVHNGVRRSCARVPSLSLPPSLSLSLSLSLYRTPVCERERCHTTLRHTNSWRTRTAAHPHAASRRRRRVYPAGDPAARAECCRQSAAAARGADLGSHADDHRSAWLHASWLSRGRRRHVRVCVCVRARARRREPTMAPAGGVCGGQAGTMRRHRARAQPQPMPGAAWLRRSLPPSSHAQYTMATIPRDRRRKQYRH